MSLKSKFLSGLDFVINSDVFGWFIFGWICFFMPLVSVWWFVNDHFILGSLGAIIGFLGWGAIFFKKFILGLIVKWTLKLTMKNAGVNWKLKDLGFDKFGKK